MNENENENENEKNRLIQMYGIISQEEMHYIAMHKSYLSFYSGMISALFAGTIAGLIEAKNPYVVACLLLGPAISFYISKLAKDGTLRCYQRFLETITIKSKIDHILKFDEPMKSVSGANEDWKWKNEALIPKRYIKDGSTPPTAEEFVNSGLKKGAHKWALKLLRLFRVLSVALFIAVLFYAIFFYKINSNA